MEWPMLEGLASGEIEQVLALGRRRRFARREVVWHEGDRADTMHLIRSGRMAVRAMTSLGEVVTVIVFGPGDAAGLVGAVASDPYFTTTGVALEPTETVAIRVDDFTDVRRRLRGVNEAVIRFLADRTLALSAQLVEAIYVPADMRVLKRLIMLCDVYGERGDGEVLVPLTQEDLAELAGVARPTVNRVLKREEEGGTLRLSRGSITITDRERLVQRAT